MKALYQLIDTYKTHNVFFESKASTENGVFRSLEKQIEKGKILTESLKTGTCYYLQELTRFENKTIATVFWTGKSLLWLK